MEVIQARWPRASQAAEVKRVGGDTMVIAVYNFIWLNAGTLSEKFIAEMDVVENWIAQPRYNYVPLGVIAFIDCDFTIWCVREFNWPDDLKRFFTAAKLELPDKDTKEGWYPL